MFRKSFIFRASLCLIFIFWGYGYSIKVHWSHEASFYVSSPALKIFQFDDTLKEIRDSSNALFDNPYMKNFIHSHKTPEKREKFFEEWMEVFSVSPNPMKDIFRGPFGIRAKKFIQNGSLLGIFSGTMRHASWEKASYNNLLDLAESGNKKELEEKMIWSASPKDLVLHYEGEESKSMLASIRYRSVVKSGGHRFAVAVHQGPFGPMNLINPAEDESRRAANVSLELLFIKGISTPIYVVRAIKDIDPKEELFRQRSLVFFKDVCAKAKELGKTPSEMIEPTRCGVGGVKIAYEQINKIAADLGIDKQLQILPTAQDREVIDVLSLFREKI